MIYVFTKIHYNKPYDTELFNEFFMSAYQDIYKVIVSYTFGAMLSTSCFADDL